MFSYDVSHLPMDRKERVNIPPHSIPYRPAEERVQDFEEAFHTYDVETIKVEAERCIACPEPQPCVEACPLHNNIPGALWYMSQGDPIKGIAVYHQTSGMSEVCGRVCPQEVLCEGSCTIGHIETPVHIGMLEASSATYERTTRGYPSVPPGSIKPTGQRVAVVGSGPAGLMVAERLAKRGHSITVYEAWPRPGGVLVYGIPNFKLDKSIINDKVRYLEEVLNVKFVCNTRIGAEGNPTVDDLLEEYDAVFLGTGAGIEATMGTPGEDLPGVYHSTDYLVRINLPDEYLPPEKRSKPEVKGKRVAVIGGGDTAMDCLRTSIRMGAKEVTCVYRRSEAEMPGGIKDRKLAKEEGAKFEFLTAPVEFIAGEDGKLKAMKCIRMKLGEPDKSGRRRPIPIEGSEFVMEVDLVVLALGYWPDPLIRDTTKGLDSDKWGLIKINPETGETSKEGVYAGGDNVTGPSLVVIAAAAGRTAAEHMHKYLESKRRVKRSGNGRDEKSAEVKTK